VPKIWYRGYTDTLNRHPAENICHAFDYARYLGCPLNRYVVINFDANDADLASWVFMRIRDKYRDWHNRKTRQITGTAQLPKYIYTLENPNGHAHVNWVIHVPDQLLGEFMRKLPAWVKKAKGRSVGPYDIHTKPVNEDTHKTLAKYVLKGIDPLFVDYLHLANFAQPQGRIWGRRACSSASLNKAARKAAGFDPKRHRNSRLDSANVNSVADVA
jgi:hypothetical protein